MPRWLSSLFLALSLLGSLAAQTKPLTQQQVDTRVEKLLAQMTLDEKVGQMVRHARKLVKQHNGKLKVDAAREGAAVELAKRA